MDSEAGRRLIAGRYVRWDAARADAAYRAGLWSRLTLADALAQAASTTPERPLIIEGDLRVDCKTLHQDATTLAKALLARVPPGSVVSFMLPNWAEAATIYLGATIAGMVVNPILPSLRERELLFMLPDMDSRIIFAPSKIRNHDFEAMLSAVCEKLDRPPQVVIVRGDGREQNSYNDLLAEQHDRALPAIDSDAVQMIMYTSGTTGSPKGVMHSHNSIGALVRQLGTNWLVEPGDVFLVPSPISHIGGSIYAFELPLMLGTTAVLMERWDGDEGLRLMEAHQCTHMAGATPFLEQLLAAARREENRLPDLKLFICGGASVPPNLIREASAQFDSAIVTRVYGSTEVPVTTVGTLARQDSSYAAETDGEVGIADLKLISSGDTSDSEGEIYARGAQMLVGYVHAEDEAGVFDSEGYYRTGDLGRWIDGRFLLVSGRAKDIIIRKGENISPKEIEDLLLSHPDIADVAIVGIPDPASGERACAVVVPVPSKSLDLGSIISFLKAAGLASFKWPEALFLWAALPRTATGKVLKHEIRKTLISTLEER